ncbi:hypothetical protein DDE83_003455 [Stemphylium lycopersici]|uniref:Ribonucleases P/MRP subunit Pop8-like domain-containing protein n=1 Tax=Stemphylium lycopersici TaxID=183478 RepID=A0A364N7B6_STELY|nr:hypothetical protein DDE83_003455 [Stemphylium lycopersici]
MALVPPPKSSSPSAPTARIASNPTGATTSADTDTATDTTMTSACPNPSLKKRKRKDAEEKQQQQQQHMLFQTTFRKASWCYLHLVLVTPSALGTSTASNPAPPTPDISPVQASLALLSALRSYLGTTGTAIPMDILKTSGRNVWVRVPRGDARGVRAAVSGWVGSVEGAELFGSSNGGGGAGGGKVDVAWRVVACEGALGLLGVDGEDGGGREMFG